MLEAAATATDAVPATEPAESSEHLSRPQSVA